MVSFTRRKAGFEANESEDVKKALNVLSINEFDLIIADLNMRNTDGISLIKNVRSNARHRAVPILILTTERDAAKRADGKHGRLNCKAMVHHELAPQDSDFRKIAGLVTATTGRVFEERKRALIHGRLGRCLHSLGRDSFSEYCQALDEPDGEAEQDVPMNAITTNPTSFFPQPHYFDYLHADTRKPDSWLIVGHSESPQTITDRFEPLGRTVYRTTP